MIIMFRGMTILLSGARAPYPACPPAYPARPPAYQACPPAYPYTVATPPPPQHTFL